MKHSSSNPSSEASTDEPLPNWKAGAGFSTFAVFSDTDVVDDPFDLAKDGRSNEDRLRLYKVRSTQNGAIGLTYSTKAGLDISTDGV